MVLITTCLVLLAVGIVLTVMWAGEPLRAPADPWVAHLTAHVVHPHLAGLRYYAWWAGLFTVTGTATALLITGAGGRLIMRLLAMTSPESYGRLTEGQAVVGFITVPGTIAFMVFGALPFAFVSAALYFVAAPWMPPGRWGGPTFGAISFIVVSPVLDPLRADNVDFDLVGPGWLAVVAFTALAILQGAALAAIAGRLSRSLPVMSRRTWPAATVALVPAVALFPIGAALGVAALGAALVPRALPRAIALRGSHRAVLVGRIAVAVAALVSLPSFINAVISIIAR